MDDVRTSHVTDPRSAANVAVLHPAVVRRPGPGGAAGQSPTISVPAALPIDPPPVTETPVDGAPLRGVPASDVDTRPRDRAKRMLDLLVVGALAVPALLLTLFCALAILCADGRPVLLRQRRVGLGGASFTMFKLRTMTTEAEPESEVPDAAHVTRVGAVLRRMSADELPQLINVARGEMSLVGPRPTFAHRLERYDERDLRRLSTPPGLTGLAQVSGRNRLSWAERTELDLTYVATRSLWLDLVILIRSVLVVLTGDGVHGHPDR